MARSAASASSCAAGIGRGGHESSNHCGRHHFYWRHRLPTTAWPHAPAALPQRPPQDAFQCSAGLSPHNPSTHTGTHARMHTGTRARTCLRRMSMYSWCGLGWCAQHSFWKKSCSMRQRRRQRSAQHPLLHQHRPAPPKAPTTSTHYCTPTSTQHPHQHHTHLDLGHVVLHQHLALVGAAAALQQRRREGRAWQRQGACSSNGNGALLPAPVLPAASSVWQWRWQR